MRRTNLLIGLNGNSVAGTKSIQIPIGYDVITTSKVGVTAVPADISNEQLLVNNVPFKNITGADQGNINQADNLAAMSVDNILEVPYEIPRMKLPAQQYSSTLNTISPDPATGAFIGTLTEQWTDSTTDTWAFYAEVDDYQPQGGPGLIERFTKIAVPITENTSYTSSMAQWIANAVGQPAFRWIHAFYLLATEGTFANGETRVVRGVQSEVVFDRVAALNARLLTQAGTRSIPTAYETSAGGLIVDFTETGMSEMVDTMQPAPAGTPVTSGVYTRIDMSTGQPQAIIAWPNVDIRLSPTDTTSANLILRSLGYVA